MKQFMGITAAMAMGLLLAGRGYAQEVPPGGPFGGAEPREMRARPAPERAGFARGGAGRQNEMLFRLLQEPQIVKELGLADEKYATLKEAFRKVQEKQIDLQAELDKLNLQQTGQIAGLLEDRGKRADAALKLVEEMGRVSTELSKLAIERILAVRENLTDDQIKKAREIGEERMQRMRENFRNRPGGAGDRPREGREGRDGGERRRGGDGEGRREGGGRDRPERD